jgi:hypothetical protein
MWWPAIGGVAIGLGGMIFPQALGVGYDTIGALLQGDVPRIVLAGVLLVKSAILDYLAGFGNLGRRTRTVADDGRSLRRYRVYVSSPTGNGLLATGQHGSRSCGHDARSLHRHNFCA